MAGYKVEICGVNTSKLPILSREEKEMLMKQIKAGDEKARERFIKGNLRLVLSVISRFSSSNKKWMTCFRWDVWDSLKRLITLICRSR